MESSQLQFSPRLRLSRISVDLPMSTSDSDPNAIKLLKRLLSMEDRQMDFVRGTREILLHYLKRLDKGVHEDGDRIGIQQTEHLQDEYNTQISATPRPNPKSQSRVYTSPQGRHHCARPNQYNIPVNFYNPAHKSQSDSNSPAISSIRPFVRSSASTSKQGILNVSRSSPNLGKISSSFRMFRSPKALEESIKNASVGVAAEAKYGLFRQKINQRGIQHGDEEREPSKKSIICMPSSSISEGNSEDYPESFYHINTCGQNSSNTTTGPALLLSQDEQCRTFDLDSVANITLNQILSDLSTDFVRSIHRSIDDTRRSSKANDVASLNTRNEYWSVSSYRTRSTPSECKGNDPLDGNIPPPSDESGDFVLPLDSLLKPIKKNTYNPITQENVQKFLAGAVWAAEPLQDNNVTTWTEKKVPLRPVEHPVKTIDSSITVTESRIQGRQDSFLESIEGQSKRNPHGAVRLCKNETRRPRFQRYPGREIVYTEYMRGDATGVTKHQLYIKRISTQSSNPPKWYPRERRQQNSTTPISSSTLPAHQNFTYKECIVCCEKHPWKDYPTSTHMLEHDICKDCVAKYLSTKIMNEGFTTIQCPAEGCVANLEYNEIKEHSSVTVFTKYDEFVCRKAYEGDTNFRWCTNRLCSVGQIVENGASTSYFACQTCKFKSCFQCRTPAHPNFTCAENLTRVGDQYFAADESSGHWLKMNTKPCFCGRWIQKMNGCDHVKCPPRPIGCGEEWCWMCGTKYDEIRKTGNTAHQADCLHWA